eukprot:4248984-Prymnesium_polylepis.2
MEPVVHQGFLIKRSTGQRNSIGKSLLLSWRRRYLILTQSRVTWYESAAAGSRQLGSLPVDGALTITKDMRSATGKAHTFALSSPPLVLVLQAESDTERDEWVDKCEAVITSLEASARSNRTLSVEPSAKSTTEEADASAAKDGDAEAAASSGPSTGGSAAVDGSSQPQQPRQPSKLKAPIHALLTTKQTEEDIYEKHELATSFFVQHKHAVQALYLSSILMLSLVGIKLQELHIPMQYDPLKFSFRVGTSCEGVSGLTTTIGLPQDTVECVRAFVDQRAEGMMTDFVDVCAVPRAMRTRAIPRSFRRRIRSWLA